MNCKKCSDKIYKNCCYNVEEASEMIVCNTRQYLSNDYMGSQFILSDIHSKCSSNNEILKIAIGIFIGIVIALIVFLLIFNIFLVYKPEKASEDYCLHGVKIKELSNLKNGESRSNCSDENIKNSYNACCERKSKEADVFKKKNLRPSKIELSDLDSCAYNKKSDENSFILNDNLIKPQKTNINELGIKTKLINVFNRLVLNKNKFSRKLSSDLEGKNVDIDQKNIIYKQNYKIFSPGQLNDVNKENHYESIVSIDTNCINHHPSESSNNSYIAYSVKNDDDNSIDHIEENHLMTLGQNYCVLDDDIENLSLDTKEAEETMYSCDEDIYYDVQKDCLDSDNEGFPNSLFKLQKSNREIIYLTKI